jgi:hypothetical protein
MKSDIQEDVLTGTKISGLVVRVEEVDVMQGATTVMRSQMTTRRTEWQK